MWRLSRWLGCSAPEHQVRMSEVVELQQGRALSATACMSKSELYELYGVWVPHVLVPRLHDCRCK